jgi:hypothetical protein
LAWSDPDPPFARGAALPALPPLSAVRAPRGAA